MSQIEEREERGQKTFVLQPWSAPTLQRRAVAMSENNQPGGGVDFELTHS